MKRFAKYRVKVGTGGFGAKVWKAQVRVLCIWMTLYRSEYKSNAEAFVRDHAQGTRNYTRTGWLV
ncbi:hypothetical protein ACEQ38_21985 [Ralstonia syzygii subsp. celebesensis]|uniref:Uncharacterized protein n=1 Tax=blood disease bacterium R229 TaxID=741978 RepID=G2ZVY1_9RALS|nr:hypothetical protein [Ralstonia syzygii]CCA83262.1 hypothetical protein BDB_mp60428 [blood disease bacterium R229]